MDIRIRTLTPLWTGGVGKTCDRLHETGMVVRGHRAWAGREGVQSDKQG